MTLLLAQGSTSDETQRPHITIGNTAAREKLDVTLSTFGHETAFHIIHPEFSDMDPSLLDDEEETTEQVVPPDHAQPIEPIERPLETLPTKLSTPPSTTTTATTTTTTKRCVSWRQTGDCNPKADREPEHDRSCDSVIHTGSSGYCECESGRQVEHSTCDHTSFTCQNQCTGSHLPLPFEYKDVQNYFMSSPLFHEMKPSNVNTILGSGKPFYMIVLCDCENDVLPHTTNEESNWPLHEFNVLVKESHRQDDFSYVYVMPSAGKIYKRRRRCWIYRFFCFTSLTSPGSLTSYFLLYYTFFTTCSTTFFSLRTIFH